MPWIQQISIEDADGLLKKEYDKALQRAGRLWHIVHVMSLNPLVLKTSIQFYGAVMFCRSPLSQVQRELLATVVSQENHCYY